MLRITCRDLIAERGDDMRMKCPHCKKSSSQAFFSRFDRTDTNDVHCPLCFLKHLTVYMEQS